MGSGTSLIFGGLLSGVGRSMELNEVENRRVALERLREQYQTDRDTRTFEQAEVTAKRSQGYTLDRDEQEQKHAIERLREGGTIQEHRDVRQQSHETRMARLTSALQSARTERELRLRDRLQEDDVNDVVVGDDGNYYIVTEGGRMEPTHVPARALSTATSEGGRLTETEQATAYREARRRWREGGQEGPEPQPGDFIGMSREDYQRAYGQAASAGGRTGGRVIRYDARGNRIGG